MPATKEQVYSALAETEQLCPAPRTLSRALQLLRDTSSDLEDIATCISRDSALSVDVLRGSNSAYYAQANRVTSILQAVQVLGVQDALRILNIVATYQMAHRSLGCYGIAADDYCAECLFSGFFMERLALMDTKCDPAEAYTTGLLRLVGRLAVNQAILRVGKAAPWDGSTPLAQWEREHAGITQAEAGAMLLRKWSFAEPIIQAVADQEVEFPSPDGDWLTLALNFTARLLPSGLTQEYIDALDQTELSFPAEHPFIEVSGLTPAKAKAARLEAHAALLKARQHFGRR
jgi:HD-like signal output (HDOD) protein